MNPTAEQRIAIETQDRALVVEAGAGTGKTWVLVQRFLHLLQTHPDWPLDRIVAITFTEKAAREMRTRLRQGIESRASKYPQDPLWRNHRLNLDRLRVSTIHSLCARLLHENAIAAGLDPRFQVLDEQEAELAKEEAIRAALQALDDSGHPALELLASLRVYDLRNEMDGMLGKRGTLHQLFNHLPEPAALMAKWGEGLATMREELWAEQLRVNPLLGEALDTLPQVGIIDPNDKMADPLMAGLQGCQALEAGDLLQALWEWDSINLVGGKADNWGGKEALAELKAYLRAIRDAARDLKNSGALDEVGPADQKAADHLQLWRALWEVLEEKYQEIKDRTQSLDFDDLELLTMRILGDTPRPARLSRSLAEIKHLMVDEFQDTNLVQQQIVYALAPVEAEGRLFVVGDAKQSIYRFRQAQVSVFNRTAGEVAKVTGHQASRLSTSFRSHQSLVNACNHLFTTVLAPLGKTYEDYEARPGALEALRSTPPEISNPITLHLVPAKDPDGGSILSEEARILEAQWIGRHLLDLKEADFKVWDKGKRSYRQFEYRDSAVLFRATTQLPLYEASFKEAGLPYLTVSGRGYYDRPEVQDLISLLAGLANPGDDLSLAAALRSPLFSLSDETLYRLRRHLGKGDQVSMKAIPFRKALAAPPPTDQPALVTRAFEILSRLWELSDRVAVWKLLREALDLSGYEAILAMADGETGRQRSNVRKFMTLARERGGTNLQDFLGRLRDLKAQEAREGEALGKEPESGAVQLMSIHASKGLEFPVVVVADMGRQQRGGFGSAYLLHDPAYGLVCKVRDDKGDWEKPAGYAWGEWLHKRMEEAEAKRLLYVACTRAADYLVLSGQAEKRGSWLDDVMTAWEIPPDGGPKERLDFDNFSVQVVRSSGNLQEFGEADAVGGEIAPGVRSIPSMAQPYTITADSQEMAVKPRDTEAREGLRPAIMGSEASSSRSSVAAFLVGNMVRKALADWEILSSPEGELLRRLEGYAWQEAVYPEAREMAVRRAYQMLSNLKAHRLFQEIQKCRKRYTEIPFSLASEGGKVDGVIDLLYQDQEGGWHLVAWKTEWCPAEAMAARVEVHREQMAILTRAVLKLMGAAVEPALCFLWPVVALRVEDW